MPAAETDFTGVANVFRKVVELTNAVDCRLKCNQTVAGATNAKLLAQYSTDGNTWVALCEVAVGASTGVKIGAWTTVPAGAKIASCHIRLRGISGDGVADPAWHFVSLETR